MHSETVITWKVAKAEGSEPWCGSNCRTKFILPYRCVSSSNPGSCSLPSSMIHAMRGLVELVRNRRYDDEELLPLLRQLITGYKCCIPAIHPFCMEAYLNAN